MPAAPIDIATGHTADFITANVPANATILEIGCGEGHLARRLQASGFAVTAIDANADAVAAARAKGVNAHEAHWPTFECEPVDVVIFTRSLHHIHELDEAINSAHTTLREGGVLLVEDFAFNEADATTMNWFAERLRAAPLAAALKPPADSFIADVMAAKNLETVWEHHHHHDLHDVASMAKSIEEVFGSSETLNAAYLYRYLISCLEETTDASAQLAAFKEQEEDAIAQRQIIPIGRRIIAKKT